MHRWEDTLRRGEWTVDSEQWTGVGCRASSNAGVRPALALLALALAAPPLAARQTPAPRGGRVPELRVKAKKSPCQAHPESAAEAAALWAEARTALDASSGDERRPPTLLVEEWRRTLGPDLRLRWERRDTSRRATLHPFEGMSPSLDRAGYIQQQGWSLVFYGPDPGFLLSDDFLRRHCFRRVEGAGASTGLAGLAFDPLPRQNLPDVAGVLWIDPVTREPRFVESAWTNAPEVATGPRAGGWSEFVRLPAGGWIVHRYYMRLPRLERGGMLGYDLVGYTDHGGEVPAVGEVREKKPNRR